MEQDWYKNAIIYAVDIHRFKDANGDGRGDFVGLTNQLNYLADLGVTCLWLLPFYPSPGRDNGYDVSNYFEIDPRLGTFDDFVAFLHAAGERSMRVMMDIVMDHTSDEHPWFQAARRDPESHYRDYYIWADSPPPVPPDKQTMFPGQEETVWSYDEIADQYYYHRFYHFEPDLDTTHPHVQEEIRRVLDFWLSFGISGFRIDAANHVIETHGTESAESRDPHGILKGMRTVTESRNSTAVLLGEADEPPEDLPPFFGDNDELHMLFNFALNNYLFLALAREEADPVIQAFRQIPDPPTSGQWANFLRNLDELDLERLSQPDREELLDVFAPKEEMRIFGRGIRRRIAPMLEGDRRRMELVFSLLFSLPGAPVLAYGDEIGMGEDLSQKGRNAVRAPMQWSSKKNGGFSSAAKEKLVQSAIDDGPFSYEEVNVADQRDDDNSFLSWMKRLIQTRRQCPELGHGTWRPFKVGSPHVLAHRCTWKGSMVVAVHNLSSDEQEVTLELHDQRGRELKDLLAEKEQGSRIEGDYPVSLPPYGYRWYRVTGEREEYE